VQTNRPDAATGLRLEHDSGSELGPESDGSNSGLRNLSNGQVTQSDPLRIQQTQPKPAVTPLSDANPATELHVLAFKLK
jgi:hypothetical protein